MFYMKNAIELTIMFAYIDDILLIGSNPQFLGDIIFELNFKFAFKIFGDVAYFLYLEVCKTSTSL